MESSFMKNSNPSKTVESTKSNRGALNALVRARRAANPEKNREQCRRYAQTHREDVNRRVRRWQLKQNPAAFRALQRQYEANARARQLQATLPESRAPAPAAVRESAATLAG